MTHHAPTLWSELPASCQDFLRSNCPHWIIRALQHCRCGQTCYISKPGQMPKEDQRVAARAQYRTLEVEGVPYEKRLLTIAYALSVSTRTVRRWIRGDRI